MGHLHYKGFIGSVDYSAEDNCFYGKVLGLRRDGITYEGDSAATLKRDFEESIDFYLESCSARGIEPEKPHSGKLILRISPELHSAAAECAADRGVSLNEFISTAIRAAVTL